MIKRFKKREEFRKSYRINEGISAPTLRVLGSDGKQIGVISRAEALEKARALGLDLVGIAPNANPPVAKIIDYKKFLYQEGKKKKEEKRKSKVSETKELRLGPFMDNHDLQVVIKKASEFLQDGNKVKLVVKFIGRQIQHPEFGERIVDEVIKSVSPFSKIERERHFEGKQLITLLSPEKKKNYEKENQEISEQKV
ncbi:MAG: translation initiation factor IF-3 [Patescibacteria group bacterium]|nr:translation initiation factor IF-3 [Patescibacteria group bacterium]